MPSSWLGRKSEAVLDAMVVDQAVLRLGVERSERCPAASLNWSALPTDFLLDRTVKSRDHDRHHDTMFVRTRSNGKPGVSR